MGDILELYDQYNRAVGDAIDLALFNQYAVVHHSNSIEGSSLTLDETILLLNENLTPKNKSFEHSQMAVDHFKALQYVVALADEKQALTPKIIQNIAALVKKNTGRIHRTIAGDIDESKGNWRTMPAKAGLSTFKATHIPERVKLLMDEINTCINDHSDFIAVNKLAFDAHFQLVSIHPFSDGNGRTSRLLMNYIQQYHQLPLSYVFSESKSEYYQVLIDARKQEDIAVFQKFMFSQLKEMMIQEINALNKDQSFKKGSGGISFLF